MRYEAKADAIHRRHVGIWDHHEGTWYTGDPMGATVISAGIPFWSAGKAGALARQLSERDAASSDEPEER